MRKLNPILPTVLLVLLLGGPLAAAPMPMPNPDFPKTLSLQKAEAVRETIREIRAMTDKPELRELGL